MTLADIITSLLGAIAISAGFVFYFANNLAKKEERNLLIKRYTGQKTIYEVWHEKLSNYIIEIEKWFRFSENFLNLKSLAMCIFFAVVYSALFFIIADVFFNRGILLKFESDYNLLQKFGIIIILNAPYLMAYLLSIFIFFPYLDKYRIILYKNGRWVFANLISPLYVIFPVNALLSISILLKYAFELELFYLNFNSYSNGGIIFFITSACILYYFCSNKVNSTSEVLNFDPYLFSVAHIGFAGAAICFISLILFTTNNYFSNLKSIREPAISLQMVFMFTSLFPFINGLMDTLSIAFTRKFIKNWLKKENNNTKNYKITISYLKYLLLDIFVASIILLFLAFTLCFFSVIIVETFKIDVENIIDWSSQWQKFSTHPFSDGLVVTLMLFSTVIPTILHFSLGIALVPFIIIPNLRPYMISQINENSDMVIRFWIATLMVLYHFLPPIIISGLAFALYYNISFFGSSLHETVVWAGYKGISLAEWLF